MSHRSTRLPSVLLCAALWLASSNLSHGAVNASPASDHSVPARAAPELRGAVRDARGRPLGGVFVSARDSAAGITVTVVTDAQGRYRLPVPGGSVRLVAHQVGFRASERPKALSDVGTMDFTLEPAPDTVDHLPSSSLLALLPDGDTKRRFILDCTGCHQFDQRVIRPGGKPRSRQQWVTGVTRMLSFAGPQTSFPIIAPGRDPNRTAEWLVRYLGDSSSAASHPTLSSPIAGDAAKVVITEYDLPAPQDLPHDLMLGPDGRVVITGMFTHRMYVLDPTSGRFAPEPIPLEGANPRALHVDADGTWWVLLGMPHRIARRDAATGQWTFYAIGMYGHSIARDTSGGIWFNGHFTSAPALIGRLDPVRGTVKTYEVPRAATSPTGGGPIPYEIRVGDDGTVWGSELHGNRVFRFTPSTSAFRTYDMPTPHSGPRRLDVAPDGSVWIPTYAAGTLTRLDPATGKVTEYPLPTRDALPYVARVDRRTGVVWVATAAADLVARFEPRSERWTEYRLPSRGALIRHIDIDPRTGTVWAAYSPSPGAPPKIARLDMVT